MEREQNVEEITREMERKAIELAKGKQMRQYQTKVQTAAQLEKLSTIGNISKRKHLREKAKHSRAGGSSPYGWKSETFMQLRQMYD